MKSIDKQYLDDITDIGCIACRSIGNTGVPAEVHHIRTGQGMSQRASNFLAIPLCADHHRNGGYGYALHAGQSAFERNYGTELDLLAMTIETLYQRMR